MMMMNTRMRSSPFTASQYQELEHQALIFKYMLSGMPIPSDLLYPMRRGLDTISITTPNPPMLFPPQPIGWGCFQMGFSRKADPEPGRCRRTDGKKWRCSKDAFQDSKYCEKHMHRGRNRSRKPVEMTTSTAAKASDPSSAILPPITAKSSVLSSLSSSFSSSVAAENHHPFLYPHSTSSRPPGIGFSPQNNAVHFNLGTGSYSADRDYRYLHGLKDGVDEHSFFSEASGSLRSVADSPFDSSWRFTPLKTSSLAQMKHRNCSVFPSSYSQQQMHNNLSEMSKQQEEEEEEEQNCFVLGTNIKSERPVKIEREEEPQQPLRRFFDEWPLKTRDSWLDLDEDRSNRTSFSTQLSISIPIASEFPAATSRSRNDD